METLFETVQIQSQLSRQPEGCEVIGTLRQRLNLSAGRAEVRGAGGCGAAPAICECRHGSGRCAHDVMISALVAQTEVCATKIRQKKWLAGSPSRPTTPFLESRYPAAPYCVKEVPQPQLRVACGF
jgi:hypothetical protein